MGQNLLNLKDMRISTPAFEHLGTIPDRHARDGDDVSPELSWTGVPDGTRQLALICHDPDAPFPRGFTHWVVYGIPADAAGIAEGGGGSFTEGPNGFGDDGYGGPQPPEGHPPHHYYFWVYALDTTVDDGPGLTAAELLDRIDGHVLDQAGVIGTYQR